MSIGNLSRTHAAGTAAPEPDSPACATIETLDFRSGRVSHVEDLPYPGELPPLELEVSRPAADIGESGARVSPTARGPRPFVRPWSRQWLAVLAAVFALGAAAGSSWHNSAGDDSPIDLAAGPVSVKGAVREVADNIEVVPILVPLHNGGTSPIEVLYAGPSGWPLSRAVKDERPSTVYPGHWRNIPASITVDCRFPPPLTASLDVRVLTPSGEHATSLPLPVATRNLVAAWQQQCPGAVTSTRSHGVLP